MNINVLTFYLFVFNVGINTLIAFTTGGWHDIPAILGWLCAAILQYQKCAHNGDL